MFRFSPESALLDQIEMILLDGADSGMTSEVLVSFLLDVGMFVEPFVEPLFLYCFDITTQVKLCRNCAITSLTNITTGPTMNSTPTLTLSQAAMADISATSAEISATYSSAGAIFSVPSCTSTTPLVTSAVTVTASKTLLSQTTIDSPLPEARPRPQSLANLHNAVDSGLGNVSTRRIFQHAKSVDIPDEALEKSTSFTVAVQVHQNPEAVPSPALTITSESRKSTEIDHEKLPSRPSPILKNNATQTPRHTTVTFQRPLEEEESPPEDTWTSSEAKRQSAITAGRNWSKIMQTFRRQKIAQSSREYAVGTSIYSHVVKNPAIVQDRNLLVPQNSLEELSFPLASRLERVSNNADHPLKASSKRGWLVHQSSLDELTSRPGLGQKRPPLIPQHSLDVQNYSPHATAPSSSKSSLEDLGMPKCHHSSTSSLEKKGTKKPFWPLRSLIPQKSLDLSSEHVGGHCEIIRHSENTSKLASTELVSEVGKPRPLLVPQNSIEMLADPVRLPPSSALRRARLVPQQSLDLPGIKVKRKVRLVHQLSLDHIEVPGRFKPLGKKSDGRFEQDQAEKQQSVESLIAYFSGRPKRKNLDKKRFGPVHMSQTSLHKSAPGTESIPVTSSSNPELPAFITTSSAPSGLGSAGPSSIMPLLEPKEPGAAGALPLLQAASAQLQFLQAARAEMNPAQAARTELLLLQAARAELEFLRAAQEKLEYLRASRNLRMSTQARLFTNRVYQFGSQGLIQFLTFDMTGPQDVNTGKTVHSIIVFTSLDSKV